MLSGYEIWLTVLVVTKRVEFQYLLAKTPLRPNMKMRALHIDCVNTPYTETLNLFVVNLFPSINKIIIIIIKTIIIINIHVTTSKFHQCATILNIAIQSYSSLLSRDIGQSFIKL